MKNLSLILNIVLLAAVAYLFFDKFGSSKPTAQTAPATMDSTSAERPLRIVYIDVDTLQERSNAYQATKKKIEKKFESTKAALAAKEAAFEKEYKEYMTKAQAGTITPNEAKQYEESLGKKEKSILDLKEKAGQELDEETMKFNEEFLKNIRHYADSLRNANGYDFVMIRNGMLSANEGLDITQALVDLLNSKK